MIRDFSNERAEVNSNYYFRRYNFRPNLDIQATPSLKFRLDATGRFGEINEPGTAIIFNPNQSVNIMGELLSFNQTRPYAAPAKNPNGSYSWAYDTPAGVHTLTATKTGKASCRERGCT